MPVVTRDRDETATRLLQASAEHSLDPFTQIDWAAPLAPDRYFTPPQRVSLYGTPLWDRLSEEQRIELSKHEAASMAQMGIWFEVILMNLLTRHVYPQDLTSRHVQYAFTEIADECRHSTMFGHFVEKLGTPPYQPGPKLRRLGALEFHLPPGPSTWAAILLGEELIDTLQREAMNDESLQPLVRQVTRLHVVEEARHVRYAREEIAREAAVLSGAKRELERMRIAITATVVAKAFIHPRVYLSVGLDPQVARAEAARNPQRHATLQWMSAKLVAFLRELDLIGGPSEALWRRAYLIP